MCLRLRLFCVRAVVLMAAHRIGQTRPVTVYRLVSQGTIEERVVALQERKRELFTAVVDEGEVLTSAGMSAGIDLSLQ